MKNGKKTMEEDKLQAKLPIGSRFFKVLMPGFQKALRLPPIISMRLNGEIPEAATLVSHGKSWRIGVGQCSNGVTFNGEGWGSFIWYHDLCVGDFVVFEHTGRMHFNTIVFGSTTCEKEFPMTSENVKDKGSTDDIPEVIKGIKRESDKATASYQHKNACFQASLHQYSVNRRPLSLHIPAAFVESNDLKGKTAVTLKTPSGDAWQVELRFYKRRERKRCDTFMGKGWGEFVKANRLKVGDICVFEINPSLERDHTAVMNVQFQFP